MRAEGVFTVEAWEPQELPVLAETDAVETATPVGLALMRKVFHGAIEGWSQTHFLAAFDQGTGMGTYLAMESFTGSIDSRTGTLNIAHSATTTGADRGHELVVIVPGSGTGELAGLTGGGRLVIDPDGTHHLVLDYSG